VPTLSPSSRLVLATIAVALLALVLTRSVSTLLTSGATEPSDQPIAISTQANQPGPTNQSEAPRSTVVPVGSGACQPTDQDGYVYNPGRLEVVVPCLYVTGIVAAVRTEADGDLHILLDVDPPYAYLLRPANQGEELGDL